VQLTQGLQRALQQSPARVATVFRGRHRSYREFGDRVARLAGALQAMGMVAGDRVGLLAQNADRWLEAMVGVWWAGGVLNPVNIRWSVPEVVYSLDDCDTGILFIDDHRLHLADGIRAGAARSPIFVHIGDGPVPAGMLSCEALIDATAPVDDAGRGGSDLACVMYTGGTTGFPKGVMQTHLNLWSSSVQRMAQAQPLRDSRVLHAAPLFHAGALSRAIMQFIAGETHVVIPAFEPLEVLQTIEREAVTETLLVPSMLQMLIDHPSFASHNLSSLQRLIYGASPIAEPVLERTMALLPGVDLYHSYGLTEACPSVSTNPPENHGPEGRANGRCRSAGRSGVGVSVKIVDEQGREQPRGTVGEVIVRGANIMAGYWNKPEETARALRDGWLWTGDGATMDDDGYLFIVDRMKDMIVSGGENVYSAEVESVVARHPAVLACAVIGVPHKRWGEAVHAVVVARPGVRVGEDEIRAHCKEHIAGYKCPKTVEFREALPMSAAGKVLKRELRAPYWEGKVRAVN
jgi:long-chain acyl-CoA synthetase